MHWIINNPVDAFMLLWALVLKPVLLFSIGTLVCAYVVIKQGWLSRKQTLYVSLIVITIFSVSVTAVKVYGYIGECNEEEYVRFSFGNHVYEYDTEYSRNLAIQLLPYATIKAKNALMKSYNLFHLQYLRRISENLERVRENLRRLLENDQRN